jgi:hypothetical protein
MSHTLVPAIAVEQWLKHESKRAIGFDLIYPVIDDLARVPDVVFAENAASTCITIMIDAKTTPPFSSSEASTSTCDASGATSVPRPFAVPADISREALVARITQYAELERLSTGLYQRELLAGLHK